jgi:hypothetical protein
MKKGLLIILILSSLMLEPVHSYGSNAMDNNGSFEFLEQQSMYKPL